MKRLTYIPLIIVFIFLSENCLARDATGTYEVLLPGSVQCSDITTDIEQAEGAEFTYLIYLHGYMTAYNMLREGKKSYFGIIEDQAPMSMLKSTQWNFITSYCKENPESALIEAIYKLVLKYNDSLW
ncbi:MAG: hypothetical protein ACR2PB_06055 [Desulfocapsaceae bacterium]